MWLLDTKLWNFLLRSGQDKLMRWVWLFNFTLKLMNFQTNSECQGIIGIGIPLPAGYMHECKLPTASFVLSLAQAMIIKSIDIRWLPLAQVWTFACFFSFSSNGELLNTSTIDTSLYRLIHPDDLNEFRSFHLQSKNITSSDKDPQFVQILVLDIGAGAIPLFRLLATNGRVTCLHGYGLKVQKHKNMDATISMICSVIGTLKWLGAKIFCALIYEWKYV